MYKQVEKHLKALGSKEIAEHSLRFFKTGPGEYGEGDKFLGIRVPPLRQAVKDFKTLSLDDCFQLMTNPYHEIRLFSLYALVARFKKADEEMRTEIYTRYLEHTEYINNWDLVDSSSHVIVGGFLENRKRKILMDLASSESLWERRIAIISTYYFIKQDDFKDTLKISKKLLKDEEDLIHKAVGWMLREIGKRDKQIEVDFLAKHYKLMPRTMLRYAIEKFPQEQRKAYLEGNI